MRLFKKIVFIGILLPFYSFSQDIVNFQMSFHVKGLRTDSVIMFVNHYDKNGARLKLDTFINIAGNDRVLRGSLKEGTDVWVQLGGFKSRKSFSFFVEKGEINITGNIDSLDNLSITGTPGNTDITLSRRVTNDIYNRIKALRVELKKSPEGSDGYKRIVGDIDTKFDSIQTYELNFIKSHPNSLASGSYMYVKQDKLPLDELEKLYNSLGQNVQTSDFGLIVRAKIKARKVVAIGNKAPAFASMDMNGKTVKLSDFAGKYVLLEFWASWCVPCRAENPDLLKAYNKFKDKGFVIIGVSLDDNKSKWEKAIQEDKLPWIHISELNAFDNKIAKMYSVQPIPDNFLIDPNGKIVARGLRGHEVDQRLEQVYNKN